MKTIPIFLIAVLLAGCATAPVAVVPGPKETIKLSGKRYVPAESLCQSYNIDYYWDAITKTIVLKKNGKEARLTADSCVALLNDSVRTMDREARVYQDSLAIPESFACKVLAPLFAERDLIRREIPEQITGLGIKSVIIDPGHGGKDPGAVGKDGLLEKDVVLDIAKRLKRRLEAAGVKVVLTREDDRFIALTQRSRIANSQKYDFFISIHANASRSEWFSGVEVFYLCESIDDDQRSTLAAQNYHLDLEEDFSGKDTKRILWDLIYSDDRKSSANMAELISHFLSKDLAQRNRGAKPARFYVLKGTNIPAVLVEVGFISNPGDERKLKSSLYRDKVAAAITAGISQYNQSCSPTQYSRQ